VADPTIDWSADTSRWTSILAIDTTSAASDQADAELAAALASIEAEAEAKDDSSAAIYLEASLLALSLVYL
jgi:hypothetical protein